MAIEDRDVIANLHRLTHQRNVQGAMLDPELLEQRCPLDNGRHELEAYAGQPLADLGYLEKLPREVLDLLLLDLDLQSLKTLRSINRRARSAVDALWQYRDIVTHAIASLRAALSLQVASYVSCRTLHQELCSKTCVNWGHFGAILYLLSCSRVCYVCLNDNPRLLPLRPTKARYAFGLCSHELAGLPKARSLPGHYAVGDKTRRDRLDWVDYSAAREAGIKLHGSAKQMEEYVTYLSNMGGRKLTPAADVGLWRSYTRRGITHIMQSLRSIEGCVCTLRTLPPICNPPLTTES